MSTNPEPVSPHEQVIRMAGSYVTARAIHAVAQLGIADHLKGGLPILEHVIFPGNETHVVPTRLPVCAVQAEPVEP